MRDCSSALATALANPSIDSLIQIDLYTFQLVDGTTYRYSGGNASLIVPSAGFPSDCILNAGANRTFLRGPAFSRSKLSMKIGIEPSSLDIEVYPAATDTIGALTFLQAVQARFFDGATVELDRFFAPPLTSIGLIDTSWGCMVWFYGRISEVTLGRAAAKMKISSLMNLLQVTQSPPRLFSAPCGFVFGGARCGYDRTNGKNALGTSTGIGQITVTAASGSTPKTVNLTATLSLDYRDGTATGLSGANAGVVRTVSDNGSGSQMIVPVNWPFPPQAGDTFTVLPGCDHTLGGAQGCTGRQNTLRYGGFPYVPPPEQAI